MAEFLYDHGRRKIFFTDHALDRWWERCEANDLHGRMAAMDHLRSRLASATWHRQLPPWTKLSLWHRARAEGFLALDTSTGFVINRNASRDLVAVTYLEDDSLPSAS